MGNIDPTVILPHRGAYAVRVRIDGCNPLDGMANIGIRPTVSRDYRQSIEVNIFDFDCDIYGKTIDVDFVGFLRTELKMGSIDELKSQLTEDRSRSMKILHRQ